MSRTTKIALGLGAAAVALGRRAWSRRDGLCHHDADPHPDAHLHRTQLHLPGGTFADGHGMRGGRHGHGGAEFGARAKELAAKLGVDEAKVADALKAFRDANKPAITARRRAEAGPRRDGEGPGRFPGEVARHR